MGSWVEDLIAKQQQEQQEADKTEAVVVNQQPPSICPFKSMIVAKARLDILATMLLIVLIFVLIIKNTE